MLANVKAFLSGRKWSEFFFAGVAVLALGQVARNEYIKAQNAKGGQASLVNHLRQQHASGAPEASLKFKKSSS